MAYNNNAYGGHEGYPYDEAFAPTDGNEEFEQQPTHGSMTVWAGSYDDQTGIDDPRVAVDPHGAESSQQHFDDFIRDQQGGCRHNKETPKDAKKARKDRKKEINKKLKDTCKNLPKQNPDGKSKGGKSGHASHA